MGKPIIWSELGLFGEVIVDASLSAIKLVCVSTSFGSDFVEAVNMYTGKRYVMMTVSQ